MILVIHIWISVWIIYILPSKQLRNIVQLCTTYPLLLVQSVIRCLDLLICSRMIFNVPSCLLSQCLEKDVNHLAWPPFLEPPHSTSSIWPLFPSQTGRTLSRFSFNSINEAWGQRDLTFRVGKNNRQGLDCHGNVLEVVQVALDSPW